MKALGMIASDVLPVELGGNRYFEEKFKEAKGSKSLVRLCQPSELPHLCQWEAETLIV